MDDIKKLMEFVVGETEEIGKSLVAEGKDRSEPMKAQIALISKGDVPVPVIKERKKVVKESKTCEKCHKVVCECNKKKMVKEDGEGTELPVIDEPQVEPAPEAKPEEEGLPKFAVTPEIVDEVIKILGIDTEVINRAELEKGLEIEQEHADITNGDPIMTGKIALAHIKEIPDYYVRLVKMEEEAKAEQKPTKEQEEVPAEEPPTEEPPVESKKVDEGKVPADLGKDQASIMKDLTEQNYDTLGTFSDESIADDFVAKNAGTVKIKRADGKFDVVLKKNETKVDVAPAMTEAQQQEFAEKTIVVEYLKAKDPATLTEKEKSFIAEFEKVQLGECDKKVVADKIEAMRKK